MKLFFLYTIVLLEIGLLFSSRMVVLCRMVNRYTLSRIVESNTDYRPPDGFTIRVDDWLLLSQHSYTDVNRFSITTVAYSPWCDYIYTHSIVSPISRIAIANNVKPVVGNYTTIDVCIVCYPTSIKKSKVFYDFCYFHSNVSYFIICIVPMLLFFSSRLEIIQLVYIGHG